MKIIVYICYIDVHKGFGFVDFEEEGDANDAIGR